MQSNFYYLTNATSHRLRCLLGCLLLGLTGATSLFAQSVELFRPADDPALDRRVVDRDADLTAFTVLELNSAEALRILADQPATLEVALPDPRGRGDLRLELERFELLGPDFSIVEMPANRPVDDAPEGVFYRGSVRDRPTSVAVISIIDGAVSGLVSLPGEFGELNLARLDDAGAYLFYDDVEIEGKFSPLECEVVEPPVRSGTNPDKYDYGAPKVDGCFGIFLDIGQEIYAERGGTNRAVTFLQEAFAQVAVLYANEEIDVTLSGTRVWTSREPFYDSLTGYRSYRAGNNVDGSVAHYVHYAGGGGTAYLNALCDKDYGYGLSNIYNTYSQVPNYSWTVFVLAHEIGHNFGSPHTHDCAWNGNDTPIDGCGSRYNGCGISNEIPENGGTIMSYCHLTSTGVNFTKGFGAQPGARIRARATAAPCKGYDCGTGTGTGGGGGGYEVAIIPDGQYYLDARHSGKRLRPNGGSTTSGATLVQFRPRTLRSQTWNLEHLGKNVYKITNEQSGYAIDVAGSSTQAAADVVQWPYSGGSNQRWLIEAVESEYYQLRALHSGQCLSVISETNKNNANVVQSPCGDGENDDWRFVPVNSATLLDADGVADLQLFPNPTDGIAHVLLRLDTDRGAGNISLSDARGRVLQDWSFTARAGTHELDIDLTARTPGLYLVRVQAGGETFTRRLVVVPGS